MQEHCPKIVTTAGGRLGDIWGFRWWGRLQDQRMMRWQHQVTAEQAHAEPPAAGASGSSDCSVQKCQL